MLSPWTQGSLGIVRFGLRAAVSGAFRIRILIKDEGYVRARLDHRVALQDRHLAADFGLVLAHDPPKELRWMATTWPGATLLRSSTFNSR